MTTSSSDATAVTGNTGVELLATTNNVDVSAGSEVQVTGTTGVTLKALGTTNVVVTAGGPVVSGREQVSPCAAGAGSSCPGD